MSFVSGIFGGEGGNKANAGLNYDAQMANVLQPTSEAQATQNYNQSQYGIQEQRNFLNALQNQGGLGNQQNVYGQQQALANQLNDIASGTGPNPALQQLQNTTGQNVAAQAALMAGQRGSSSNAGLLARQAAMQGNAAQQQAVGQGAWLQAQQQFQGIGSLQQQQQMLGQLANQQVAQQAGGIGAYNQAAQSEQQNVLNALANYNNANVATTSNVNSSNAGIAQQAAKSQSGLMGNVFGTPSALFGAKGGMVPSNCYAGGGAVGYADGGAVGPQSFVGQFLFGSAPNNQMAVTPGGDPGPRIMVSGEEQNQLAQDAQRKGLNKLLGPDTKAAPKMGGAQDPSALQNNAGAPSSAPPPMAPAPEASSALEGAASSAAGDAAEGAASSAAEDALGAFLAKGGSVPGHYDSGGIIGTAAKLLPLILAVLSKGGQAGAHSPKGPVVPGAAEVKGDSLKNDKVPAMLSPKEIIIPRSITMAPNAPEKAKEFVAAILAKQGMQRK